MRQYSLHRSNAKVRGIGFQPLLIAMASLFAFELVAIGTESVAPTTLDSVASLSAVAVADNTVVSLRFENTLGETIRLVGRDATVQLIVTGSLANGEQRDWTRQVHYTSEPASKVRIDSDAVVTPLTDGTVTITAHDSVSGQTATALVEIAGAETDIPISFPGQIVPLFTKHGCNGGGCHGKLMGQNGFKLSLLGFEPREDFEHLVNEGRGRRVFPAWPENSLLLLKATNSSPHGGGQRLSQSTDEYNLMHRWIAQGMPYGTGDEPTVVSIAMIPSHRQLAPRGSQQLAVVATYSDGSNKDVTRSAVYESNDPSMAEVTSAGFTSIQETVGDVAIMARFQGHSAVFRADIPRSVDSSATLTHAFPEPRNAIDTHVFNKLRLLRIPPSPRCDDATYLRRVTIDIAGRLPTVAEATQFAADTAGDRRDTAVERLLASSDYADYFAGKWNTVLRNQRTAGGLQFSNLALYEWIREGLYENKPYDQFVRELLTASGTVSNNPAVAWYRQVPDTNQRLEDTSQLFLGQRIQCARCHHHPYEKWSQQDYSRMAAFFSLVADKKTTRGNESAFFARAGTAAAAHPKTGQSLTPAALDGIPATIAVNDDPRQTLVDWMVKPDNPFFARALANRYWKHFMGRAIVEPEDDLRITNPPSNPELLDALAVQFVESRFDLKSLIRSICQSESYSRSSDALTENLDDHRNYSRFYPKRMTAEVLLDSIDNVTESTTRFPGLPPGTRAVALPDTGFDSYFLTVFGRPQSSTACECERSQGANLTQSLHLLNSEEMQKKLSGDNGRAARLAADVSQSDESKVVDLYVAALCRHPRDAELKTTLGYLASKPNRREAYEDVIWSLLNSKEFLFNH